MVCKPSQPNTNINLVVNDPVAAGKQKKKIIEKQYTKQGIVKRVMADKLNKVVIQQPEIRANSLHPT